MGVEILRVLEESSGYYNFSFSNRYMNWKRYRSIRNAFLRALKRHKFNESIKVLDAGCGNGQLIYRLKAEFSKIYKLHFTGIDVSWLDIDFANKRKEYFSHRDCEFLVMDACNLKFENEKFDIVISSEVLEHIPEAEVFIKQIYRILKNGGLVIITTPHKGGGILARLLRLVRPAKRKQYIYNFIEENERDKIRLASNEGISGAGCGHISVKSPHDWIKIFKRVGFKVESLEGTSGLLFGSPELDKYRILFALTVILDVILEKLPFTYLWSESLFFELSK